MTNPYSTPIGNLIPDKPIHLYGAGVAGLLMAYYLKRAGLQVIVWEKENRVGGKIHTLQGKLGIAETAANAIFTNDDVWELIEDLKLTPIISPEKAKKNIFLRGAPRSHFVPKSKILTLPFKLFRKINHHSMEQMNLQEFLGPVIGQEMIDQVVGPAMGGIYAISPKELHLVSLLRGFVPNAKNYLQFIRQVKKTMPRQMKAKRSISFQGGMVDFINALKNELKDCIRTGQSPTPNFNDNIIFCTPADETALLLKNEDAAISKQLLQIQYLSMSTVTVLLEKPIDSLRESFGVVSPVGGLNSKGIINNHFLFPNRCSPNSFSYTFILNQHLEDLSLIKDDLQKLGSGQNNILESFITHWPKGIPAYNLQRYEAIKQCRVLINQRGPGLVLFGNYTGGISIREMVSSAKNFAYLISSK